MVSQRKGQKEAYCSHSCSHQVKHAQCSGRKAAVVLLLLFFFLSSLHPSFSSLTQPLSCWMISLPLALTLSFLAVHTLPPFQATHLRPLLLLQFPGEPFLMLLWPNIQGTPHRVVPSVARVTGQPIRTPDAGCSCFTLALFPPLKCSRNHTSPLQA